MNKILIILLTFTLSGCSMMPRLTSAKPEFPGPFVDEKTQQMPKCEDLKQVPADVNSMSEVFKIIVENYTTYWRCSNQVDGWAEWYEQQKKNYDSK